MKNQAHIVIVGGGVAGLELATRLGDDLAKKDQATITLVDANLSYIWKPLWHELAVGTLYSNEDELNYVVHAYKHNFEFQCGKLIGIDHNNKLINLAPVHNKKGQCILPERSLSYDILVLAIGSQSNDFNIPGARDYCHFLDSQHDCQQLHHELVNNYLMIQEKLLPELKVVIVGGGATGVELAAELQSAVCEVLRYKDNDSNKSQDVKITLVESAPRLLAGLSAEISVSVQNNLESRGITVLTKERVKSIDEHYVHTENLSLKADLKLWAAGIIAPPVLKELGLKTNAMGQIIVKQDLQSVDDDSIFALGDCASCPQPNSERPAPPRAQVAHQEAELLARSLKAYLNKKALLPYTYRDHGSLISLSGSNAFGQLIGKSHYSLLIKGKLASMAYRFLYRQYQASLYGWSKVILLILGQWLSRAIRPRLKLH